MAIPAEILRQVKLMTHIRDTERAARIDAAYRRVLAVLSQQTEWIVEFRDIPGVATLSIVSLSDALIRPLAVLYDKQVLDKTVAWSQDVRNPQWQRDAAAAPEVWFWNQIPASLNGQVYVGAEQIAVAPPVPDPPGTFTIVEAIQPADDAILPPWMVHFLALRTTAEVLRVLLEENEAPDPQVAAAQIQFFSLAGDLWQQTIGKAIPA